MLYLENLFRAPLDRMSDRLSMRRTQYQRPQKLACPGFPILLELLRTVSRENAGKPPARFPN
jgi:hypothetical protein